MYDHLKCMEIDMSLPSRERGLKSQHVILSPMLRSLSLPSRERGLKWREIPAERPACWSLPSRERGLKYRAADAEIAVRVVAPLAGAWIEISSGSLLDHSRRCRSPRGSVD